MSSPPIGALHGLMQHWPMTVDRFLEHANRWHPRQQVVTREPDGSVSRSDYASVYQRAHQLSNALRAGGIVPGDRVATLAMNSVQHLEAWYAIMGIGAVCHTLNPRLFDDTLHYIISHASDRWILADGVFAPMLARLLPQCPGVERVVFLTPPPAPCELPCAQIALEDLLAPFDAAGVWGGFDEQAAAGLCYTSGTTGNPKGVLYSHRSNVLHTLIILQQDVFGLSARDVVLPIVPLFHANAWGVAFAAPAAGAKLVMPGPRLDGASVYELLEQEQVTFTAGVPTVWQGLLQYLDKTGAKLTSVKRMVVGGAACPPSMIERFLDEMGIEVLHAWGMTELSPVGTVCTPTTETQQLPAQIQRSLRNKQGRVPFGVDMRIADDAGQPVAEDGKAYGRLSVRGPAVAAAYFGLENEQILDAGGFFDTGDIATIDANGFLQITDRSKDVIKSGGEWISSIELENIAAGHPAVLVAAVIAMPDAKWNERPLLLVQLREGAAVTPAELLALYPGRVANWWIPDEARVIANIPLGATGKIDKKLLRQQLLGVGNA